MTETYSTHDTEKVRIMEYLINTYGSIFVDDDLGGYVLGAVYQHGIRVRNDAGKTVVYHIRDTSARDVALKAEIFHIITDAMTARKEEKKLLEITYTDGTVCTYTGYVFDSDEKNLYLKINGCKELFPVPLGVISSRRYIKKEAV